MITLQKLQTAIYESQQLPTNASIPRPKHLAWLQEASQSQLIKAVVGFRRSGKSHLLKIFTKSLLAQGVLPQNIFYLNFENDLLTSIRNVEELRNLWDLYLKEIAVTDQAIYVIWDEVQLVSGFESLVRTLYETGRYQIFLSGSNSQLLSGELSSSLAGRSLQLEIQPFEFKDYLIYRQIKHDNYYSNQTEIDQAFLTYLRRGGLAEQFGLSDELAKNYCDGLIQKIILDDVAKRYQIEKINVLRQAFDFVCGNVTSTLSLRKISNRLAEQALPISTTTLDSYLFYWQTTYALQSLTKFDYRLSRVFDRNAKYYLVDNALISGREESDEKRLENLVYNTLCARYGREKVFFAQDHNGYEIDFLVKTEQEPLFFQVCYKLGNEQVKREIGNLEIIQKYISGKATVLVLYDVRSRGNNTNSDDSNVVVKSVVEWLLN